MVRPDVKRCSQAVDRMNVPRGAGVFALRCASFTCCIRSSTSVRSCATSRAWLAYGHTFMS